MQLQVGMFLYHFAVKVRGSLSLIRLQWHTVSLGYSQAERGVYAGPLLALLFCSTMFANIDARSASDLKAVLLTDQTTTAVLRQRKL